jgi:hypothetical protein
MTSLGRPSWAPALNFIRLSDGIGGTNAFGRSWEGGKRNSPGDPLPSLRHRPPSSAPRRPPATSPPLPGPFLSIVVSFSHYYFSTASPCFLRLLPASGRHPVTLRRCLSSFSHPVAPLIGTPIGFPQQPLPVGSPGYPEIPVDVPRCFHVRAPPLSTISSARLPSSASFFS